VSGKGNGKDRLGCSDMIITEQTVWLLMTVAVS